MFLLIAGVLIILGLLIFIGYKLYYKENENDNHNSIEFHSISVESDFDNGDVSSNLKPKVQNQGFEKVECEINQQSQISNRNSKMQISPFNSKIQPIKTILTSRYKADEQRNQKVQKIINFIYVQTQGRRNVDNQYQYFLGGYYQQQEFYQEYNIKKLEQKQKMKQYCSAFRAVRGDGNCFYTAFGFQFLEILLFKYTNDQFQQFLNSNQVNFQIRLNNKNIVDESNIQELRDEFFFRLERLKLIEDIELRKQTLYQEFRAYEKENEKIDGCFYGLSTIFFRNLALKAVDSNEDHNDTFERQILLTWEVECNENEIVIASLAKFLKLQIQLIFFYKDEDPKLMEYGNQSDNKVILLIRPGHYNIGIKNT